MLRSASSVMERSRWLDRRLQAVRLELALHQVALGDLELLLFGVAGELDDLHAVAQRPRDGVEHVRRGDEHHVRQVEVDREVVVAEARVLLRVEHLEQRRRRVAVEAALPELVDLVEHQHGVLRLGAAQRLDDVARQRADVGAPVAADLGLVVHAAERDALELAAGGARDRLAERGLAHARRADEAQDRALAGGVELPHREVLEDPALDLVEAEVVLVEHPPRFRDVDRLLGERLSTGSSASHSR